jgi:Fe2+ transport system protein FeoA
MKSPVYPLNLVSNASDYTVIGFSENAPQDLKIRLSVHGLTPGSKLKLVRKGRWTPLLIEVRGGLLAISGHEANHIQVQHDHA